MGSLYPWARGRLPVMPPYCYATVPGGLRANVSEMCRVIVAASRSKFFNNHSIVHGGVSFPNSCTCWFVWIRELPHSMAFKTNTVIAWRCFKLVDWPKEFCSPTFRHTIRQRIHRPNNPSISWDVLLVDDTGSILFTFIISSILHRRLSAYMRFESNSEHLNNIPS